MGPKGQAISAAVALSYPPRRAAPEPFSDMLFAMESGRRISLETGSEISIGQIETLRNVRLVEEAVFVQGVGGICLFELEGDL